MNKLAFEYDRLGDILYLSKCPVYPEQTSTELTPGITLPPQPHHPSGRKPRNPLVLQKNAARPKL